MRDKLICAVPLEYLYFMQAPTVINGASEVLLNIFGQDRLPARSAIGVAALPGGASVEIDAVVRLRD